MADTIIEIFTGNIGSGKSYSAVERIFRHFCEGGHIYTNIRIEKEPTLLAAEATGIEIQFDEQYHYLTNEQIADFPRHIAAGTAEKHVLVVIDEAHLYFNSRDWNKTSRSITALLSQTRKHRCYIIAVVQHEHNLDSQFRRLAQYIWFFVDLSKIYFPGLQIQMTWLKMTQGICFDAQNTKIRHKVINFTRRQMIYDMYASTALLVETDVKTFIQPIKPKKLHWKAQWIARLKLLGVSPKVAQWLFV